MMNKINNLSNSRKENDLELVSSNKILDYLI